jgi:hypothetical protein
MSGANKSMSGGRIHSILLSSAISIPVKVPHKDIEYKGWLIRVFPALVEGELCQYSIYDSNLEFIGWPKDRTYT